MTDPTNEPAHHREGPDVQTRRMLLQLLAADPVAALDVVRETFETDEPMPVVLQCIALELVATGCDLLELQDELPGLRGVAKIFGGLTAGMWDMPRRAASPDDDEEFVCSSIVTMTTASASAVLWGGRHDGRGSGHLRDRA